jgi:hypothetical protein
MRIAMLASATLLLGLALGLHAESSPPSHWDKLSVELPVSTQLFPAGDAQAIANSQCLICHSVDMVLTQPARTPQQWTETINKMRTAYGAPVPADQVGPLALYLSRMEQAP